jgi:hypothetical protein
LNLGGGIHLHFDSLFHKNYRLNIGAIGSLASNFNAQHLERIQAVSTRGAIIDSVTIAKEYGKLSIPFNYGVGISFGKPDRWLVGADFTYLDFQKFDYSTNDGVKQFAGTPTTGYRAGIGAEIIPRVEDFTNYLNRIIYRVGFSYEKSPITVFGNNPLTDIGGTFGFSFPVSSISTVDLGVKIGKRGVISQNSFEENYFRIYFGVTFNDRLWFIKRKFE